MASVPPKEEEGISPVLSSGKRMFSLRIVHLDYYMAPPLAGMDDCYSHFQGCSVREVPVVRIFGATTSAQKTCMHLHKAFPYFYVSYDDDLPQEVNEALGCVRRLASAVEKALKVASTVGSKRQHVHSCSLVRGKKYYGYYPKEQLFVKIILYYPQEVSRTSTLLLSGGIMNHKFQPYEAHIPYLLQILIDYNLYGMGHLHLSSLKFRNPIPQALPDLTNLVNNVKSEFSWKMTDSVAGNQNPDSPSLHTSPSAKLDSNKKKTESSLSPGPHQEMKEMSSMCPVSKTTSPSRHQSTQATGSQPDQWLYGSIPGEWIWPLLASLQGKGPFCRQSTCELEADTSVEDILNRGELLFRPLQQAGPEVKMVQSLTPIWEEELLRSGGDGPAGPVDDQYQPTARTVPPPSSLEQAMREVLFKIANAEEHQVQSTPSSDSATKSGMPSAELGPMQDPLDQEPKPNAASASSPSVMALLDDKMLRDQWSSSPTQSLAGNYITWETLLQCTAVANGEPSAVSGQLTTLPFLISNSQMPTGPISRIGSQEMSDEDMVIERADLTDHDIVVNEEAIKSHLSQQLQSQELDDEVAEFLRWMGASQHSEDRRGKDKGDETALTQMFSSPGMDSALLKALADYESATEEECQAILDCVFNKDEEESEQGPADVDVTTKKPVQFKGESEVETGLRASTSSVSGTYGTHVLKLQDDLDILACIPQTDGPYDEEDLENEVGHDEQPSKRLRVDDKRLMPVRLDNKLRENLQKASAEQSKEVSLRELMRRQRERRPRSKDVSSSPSSLSEDPTNGLRKHNLKETSGSISSSEELGRSGRRIMRGIVENHRLEVSTRIEQERIGSSSTILGRPADSSSDPEKMGRGSCVPDERLLQVKRFKYAALPMVKVKIETCEADPQNQDPLERGKQNLGGGLDQDWSKTEQPSKPKSHDDVIESSLANMAKKRITPIDISVRKHDDFNKMSRGDDRDCGGGQGPSTFPSQECSKRRALESSHGGWLDGTSSSTSSQSGRMPKLEIENENYLNELQSLGKDNQNNEFITRENQSGVCQQLVESSNHCGESLRVCTGNVEEFSESQIILEAAENEPEMNVVYSVKEEEGENDLSILSTSSNDENDTGRRGGVVNEIQYSSQYHFTDISDDSQDSFDSATGEWGKEHKWNAAEAFLEDQGKEEVQSFHGQEQREPFVSSRDNSLVLLIEAGSDVVSPLDEEQNPAGSTKPEPSELNHPGLHNGSGFLAGPSSPVCPVLDESSHGSLDGSTMPSSMHSLSAVKSSFSIKPEGSPQHLQPCIQSTFACEEILTQKKASMQGPIAFTSVWPARAQGGFKVSKTQQTLHAGVSGSGSGASESENVVRENAIARDKGTEYERHDEILSGVDVQALASLGKVDEVEKLFPMIFRQRPPDKQHLLLSYGILSSSLNEGGVFYGNRKDVPDRPSIMAGLIFDVKTKEAAHLRPFAFGGSNKRSNFEQGARCRQYIDQGNWGAQHELDSVIGIHSHFENDGTVSYLMSPAKAPPSPLAVSQWVSSMQLVLPAENVKGTNLGREQMFTVDANTGKLVPLTEIGSANNSQESLAQTQSSTDDAGDERPASPKYDERHVLNLTHPTSSLASWMLSEKKSHGMSHNERPGRGPSPNVFTHPDITNARSKPPLGSSSAQISNQHTLATADISKSEDLKTKVEGAAGNTVCKDEQSKNPLEKSALKSPRQWRDISQMTAISPAGRSTPLSQAGFRDPASDGGGQQVTLMSIEVFAETRGQLLPDPRYDAVGCIVIVIQEDVDRRDNDNLTIVLIRDMDAHSSSRCVDGVKDCETIYLPDEAGIFKCFARLVHQCDPDMLLGWEIQGYSLGFLAERAANLGISLLKKLSRIPPLNATASEVVDKETGLEEVADLFDKLPLETKGGDEPIIEDEWGRTHGSGLYVGGRIILNLWRIMRGEVKLGIYSLEAVAEAVLRRRVPRVPWQTLTRWFSLGPGGGRFRCLEYFIDRARLNLQIIYQLDLMNRTAELARVFGIDFYSVFSRGSQFRVESMMARLAHTQNYLLVSPTRQQVADQPAMECLPLVMEPESRFYTSPVIVLDFQSLYPSMIIAYNLCFSTCLGKLIRDNPKVLGVSKLSVQQGLLDSLKECMTISPNGVMFTPKEVRPGVLPRLLQEILTTRIMVKKAMKKLSPDQRVLQRVLNARQFALKLIANVTYGYTAAGFSGRMPCAEIADSIVQCGRLTLERAIHLVNSHPRWGARVVYGDTDSMFVLLEGRTREEAHAIGQEIATAVTETNPPPVTLKMEKVYHPCVLLTKKRYVGYSYESAGQVKPTFDAKGIETIRRDSCPAVAKALEHSLKILFDSKDLSQVKQYLQRQWGKILSGRVSLQDFVFAKEVRLGTYSSRSPVLPPAAIVASKAMAVDPRAEPRYAERIPYVVVHGEPGARLVDMVVDPLTLLDNPSLRLHDTYYITKQIIPACQRIFMLVGADLKSWFSEMPRVYRPPVAKRISGLMMGARSSRWDPEAAKRKSNLKHGTIDQYYLSRHCCVCGEFTRASQLLCSSCMHDQPGAVAPILLPARTARLERELLHLQAICRHCGGGDGSSKGDIACVSLDCSVFFERRKVRRELQVAGAVAKDLEFYPPCLPELF